MATAAISSDVEAVANEDLLWRLQPHTFAARASDGRWKAARHLRYISRAIAEAVAAGNRRLIVNMPPGHGKSSLISLWTPCWFLDHWPQQRVICASHGDELARSWGRAVRDEIERNPLIRTSLRPDSSAANRWNTPEGGGMFTVGIGGGVTGWRANLMLIDDPHPAWKEVNSLTHRRTVAEWMDGTATDRMEPNGVIVLLMHRWHEDDLTGYLMNKKGERWKVIRLPALAEPNDPLGRVPGEALWPARFTAQALHQTHADVTDFVWYPKFQQLPLGVGTNRVWHRYQPEFNHDPNLTLSDRLPLQVDFDFNYNPGMHVLIGQYDERADVGWSKYEIHGPYMRLEPALTLLGQKILSLNGGRFPWPALEVYGDASGTQERAETTASAWEQVRAWGVRFMEPFRPKPFRVRVPSKQPPIKQRMAAFNAALRDDLNRVHFYVDPNECPRLVDDLKNLKTDALGLIDKDDLKLSHASEAVSNRFNYLRPAVAIDEKRSRKGHGPVTVGSRSGRRGKSAGGHRTTGPTPAPPPTGTYENPRTQAVTPVDPGAVFRPEPRQGGGNMRRGNG